MAFDRHPMENRRTSLRERGSVLMLMPAAVLIMLVLGSIAVDHAVVFGAQRDLVATAQAAANDAASLGVDIDVLRTTGEVDVDEGEMARAVAQATAIVPRGTSVDWRLEGDVVVVTLHREVPLVFAPAVPGGHRTQPVEATATAELRRR